MNAIPARLSASSTDEDLLAAVTRRPETLSIAKAEMDAAYRSISSLPIAENLGLFGWWAKVCTALDAARPAHTADQRALLEATRFAAAKQLRITLDARDALQAVLADRLTKEDLEILQTRDPAPGTRMALIRPVMAKYPGLAAWQARRDKEAAAAAASQHGDAERLQQAQDSRQAVSRMAAAQTLLRRLAADGVHLTAAKGSILAHPASMLSPEYRAAVAEHRVELLALLSAAPEALA